MFAVAALSLLADSVPGWVMRSSIGGASVARRVASERFPHRACEALIQHRRSEYRSRLAHTDRLMLSKGHGHAI
ncbi:MAG: hypothetical protein ABI128_06900 [Rhodanobacter sp.]